MSRRLRLHSRRGRVGFLRSSTSDWITGVLVFCELGNGNLAIAHTDAAKCFDTGQDAWTISSLSTLARCPLASEDKHSCGQRTLQSSSRPFGRLSVFPERLWEERPILWLPARCVFDRRGPELRGRCITRCCSGVPNGVLALVACRTIGGGGHP